MNTLKLAFLAAAIVAAPMSVAFAADEPTPAPAVMKPSAPNKTNVSKNFEIGDRMPGSYVSTSAYKADVSGLGLPAAPAGYRWVHVTDNAYLVNETNDAIKQIVGVPAKQKN
jgi:Ni/Co efflux regulator RcnB